MTPVFSSTCKMSEFYFFSFIYAFLKKYKGHHQYSILGIFLFPNNQLRNLHNKCMFITGGCYAVRDGLKEQYYQTCFNDVQ